MSDMYGYEVRIRFKNTRSFERVRFVFLGIKTSASPFAEEETALAAALDDIDEIIDLEVDARMSIFARYRVHSTDSHENFENAIYDFPGASLRELKASIDFP